MERGRGTLVILVAATVVLCLAPTARADGHCAFVEANAALTIPGSAEVVRAGEAIHVDGAPCVDATTDAVATVTNTDLVGFTGRGGGEIVLDLRGGPFAPGKTSEATGHPEIEFVVDPERSGAQLGIEGSGAADVIKLTSPDASSGAVNLNGDEVPKDADVTFELDAFHLAIVVVRGGDDRILAHGHGEQPYLGTLWTWAGRGDDEMKPGDGVARSGHDGTLFVAGPGTDTLDVSWLPATEQTLLVLEAEGPDGGGYARGIVSMGKVERLIGHQGRDVFVGSALDEILVGLGGSDELTGRGGDDTVLGGAGRDTLTGGPGIDDCDGSRIDASVATCER